jgi:hypothetical protein
MLRTATAVLSAIGIEAKDNLYSCARCAKSEDIHGVSDREA